MKLYGKNPSISSQRGSAFAVDAAVLLLVLCPLAVAYEGTAFGVIAAIGAVAYFLCRDGLFGGRGLGKLACGIRLIDARTGRPAGMALSVKKNILPLAALALGCGVGWLISLVASEKVAGIVGSAVILGSFAALYSGYQSDLMGPTIDQVTKTKVVFASSSQQSSDAEKLHALRGLEGLRDAGVITPQQFERMKAQRRL